MVSNEKSAVFLVAGLLVGVAVGFGGALLTGSSDDSYASPSGVLPTGLSDVSAADAAHNTSMHRTAVAAPTTVTAMASTIPKEQIENAIAGAESTARPAAEPATGEGRIEGLVQSVDGTPIGNVLLVATQRSRSTKLYGSKSDSIGRGSPSERSLRDSLDSSANSWAKSQGRKFRMRTDQEGRFVLAGLPDGRFYIRGYADGWVFEASPSGYVSAAGGVVYLTGTRVRDVEIDVRLPDGTKPEIAAIHAKIGGSTSTFEWRPGEPKIRLREGNGTVQARAAITSVGTGSTSPPGLESDAQALSPETTTVSLELVPNTGLWGEVRDTWGGSSWSEVKLIELGAGKQLQDDLFAEPARTTRVRRDMYHFDDLDPGRYGVALTSRNRTVIASQVVTVAEDLTRLDLEIGKPDPASYIRVKCVGPEGQMLSRVSFNYSYRTGGGSSSGSPSVKRSPEGIYWLEPSSMLSSGEGIDFETLPADSTLELTARHSRYGSTTVLLVAAQRSVDIRFVNPSTLEVQVLGYEASPMRAKLRLKVSEKKRGSNSPSHTYYSGRSGNDQAVLTSSGKAVYDTLSPGTWVVSLIVGESSRWSSQGVVAKVEVHVGPGKNVISIAIPPLYELNVHAPTLKPNTHLWAQRVDKSESNRLAMSRSGQLGPNRRIRWTGLPAGTYRVQGGGITKAIEAQVPGPTVVLKGAVYDCLQVAISSKKGQLYTAGFRAGDLIVAVGGTELTQSNLYDSFQEAGKQAVAVMRDGKRLELQLDLSDMWQRSTEVGGTLMQGSRPKN